MGDESIIHPPSPIFTKRHIQEEHTSAGLSQNMWQHLKSDDMISSELSRIHAKGIGEGQMLRPNEEFLNAAEQSMN